MTNPFLGNTTIALGSSKSKSARILLEVPSTLDTSMTFLPLSVQYKFFATQSTAKPSAVTSSSDMTVLKFEPFQSTCLRKM